MYLDISYYSMGPASLHLAAEKKKKSIILSCSEHSFISTCQRKLKLEPRAFPSQWLIYKSFFLVSQATTITTRGNVFHGIRHTANSEQQQQNIYIYITAFLRCCQITTIHHYPYKPRAITLQMCVSHPVQITSRYKYFNSKIKPCICI